MLVGATDPPEPLPLGLFLWGRLVASHAIVNVAFIGLAKIEGVASALAVNENGGFRVGALPFCFGDAPRETNFDLGNTDSCTKSPQHQSLSYSASSASSFRYCSTYGDGSKFSGSMRP